VYVDCCSPFPSPQSVQSVVLNYVHQLPVLVVATKADLSAIPSDGDEAAAVEAILAETDSLLTKFPVPLLAVLCCRDPASRVVVCLLPEC
jgi:hypothetical protein